MGKELNMTRREMVGMLAAVPALSPPQPLLRRKNNMAHKYIVFYTYHHAEGVAYVSEIIEVKRQILHLDDFHQIVLVEYFYGRPHTQPMHYYEVNLTGLTYLGEA